MKKLNDLKVAKEAILSEIEAAEKGGINVYGSNTNYYGPTNPSEIKTLVDGQSIGNDAASDSMFGDTWRGSFSALNAGGTLKIKHP